MSAPQSLFSDADLDLARRVYSRAAQLCEQGWCKFVGARDKHGNPTPPWSPAAERFCATGALVRAVDELGPPGAWGDGLYERTPLNNAMRALWLATGLPKQIPDWNNRRQNRAPVVRALLDAAKAEPVRDV